MIKRPGRNDEVEDILEMEREFMAKKAKDSNFKPAASVVKMPKKSLFAQSREVQEVKPSAETSKTETLLKKPQDVGEHLSHTTKEILSEIHEKIVGDANSTCIEKSLELTSIVLGDIVEKQVDRPKKAKIWPESSAPFPKISEHIIKRSKRYDLSLFAQSNLKKNPIDQISKEKEFSTNNLEESKNNLLKKYGSTSVIVNDEKTAEDVHKQSIEILSSMTEEEILAEKTRLLESMDPSWVKLLKRKRIDKAVIEKMDIDENPSTSKSATCSFSTKLPLQELVKELSETNSAIPLVEQSTKENWIHFNVVEKDKLAWMEDIPKQIRNLKPGEKFEARFDWKGLLLPYKEDKISKDLQDDRELYFHGEEPNRPGYTLQELFRLARSTVVQQRLSAFGSIAGMFNIYNQGFYDQVLDLPISKMFFLLRFGLDDNTLAMLEVVSKAMAYLFYNETDEILLDFIYDNPGCYWQPTLGVLTSNIDNDDPMSVENLQKQLEQLRVNADTPKYFEVEVNDSEEESRTSMNDFQLAETDLIECLLRTNILQRINFILNVIRPDNSTVTSCLKLLIRLARTSKDVALQIVNKEDLMKCLIDNFLPGLNLVDTSIEDPPFYKYPQHLCLKLLRVLASQNLGIALKLTKLNIIEKLKSYLFNREDVKNKLIKVQIESLRLLRCFFLLNVDNALYKEFLPVFRYMLEWHYNHVIYEEGGPYLLRQHASALLAAIASIPTSGGLEVNSLLGEALRDCCCNWFNKAKRNGLKEFSQATLLSSCLNVVTWFARNNDDEIFENFYNKYLSDFIKSNSFIDFIQVLRCSSIIARTSVDRRNVHPPLPNVGSIIINDRGPQLVIPQNYVFYFLLTFWNLLEWKLLRGHKALLNAITTPDILENLARFLNTFRNSCNHLLAANFFSKIELLFISKLLCFDGFEEYFTKSQIFQIVYNFLCCLTSEHIREIEQLFQRYIFNKKYIDAEETVLTKWRNSFMELVYPHAIIMSPIEMKLSMAFTQMPILPRDWPFYQLRVILQNFISNIYQKPAVIFSERDVLKMTLQFVALLEDNAGIEIATPTEQLMYLMIAFMGPDSQFLDNEMHQLMKNHIYRFFVKYKDHTFDFEKAYEGKCRFENLYALFVDHFQAASYGDELFSSLVLLPTAQKYNKKWRGRLWSDFGGALRSLNCDGNFLMGGIQSYLEPFEKDKSMVRSYRYAIRNNLVREGSIPYIIAKYHIEKYSEYLKQQKQLKQKQSVDKMECDNQKQ